MATNNQNINIIVNAINKAKGTFADVEKSFTKMQYNADKTRAKLEAMQPAFKKMAQVGTVGFTALSAGIVMATNKASDFEEATNKFNVVFQDVGAEADAMAKKLNDSYGLSLLKSKELLSGTGDLLTGLGMTGDTALDLSGKVNTLAVDLASFTNAQGGAEAVSGALTKALLGERESLKTYGIALSEADIQAGLAEKGMSDLTGEALRQAKAQVTLELAMKQSKNAIGDYERSAGSLAQSKKELSKTFEDMSVTLGTTFMPIINDLVQKLTPLIQKFADWVAENPKLARNIILVTTALFGLIAVVGFVGMALLPIITAFTALQGAVWANVIAFGALALPILAIIALIGVIVAVIINWVKNWEEYSATLAWIWENFVDAITLKWQAFVEFIREALENIKLFFQNVWEGIKLVIFAYFNVYKTIITSAINGIVAVVGGLKDAFSSVFDWINEKVIEPFMNKLESVMSYISKIISKMKEIGGNVASGVSAVFGKRASGGSVDPSKPYMVGEKGPEMFVPNSFGSIVPSGQLAGGGGINITFTGNSFMGEDDMAEKVGNQITRILKDNSRI